MAPAEQSALWARVSDPAPVFPTRDALQFALTRAERERAALSDSVRELAIEAAAWRAVEQARGDDLRQLRTDVGAISRRLQRTVANSDERHDRQRDALTNLHDQSADLVDAVRSHTQRTLHELEQLREELGEATDRAASRTRLAFAGCLAACAVSVAAWAGGGTSPAKVDPPVAAAAAVSPVQSTLLAGYRPSR